MSQLIIQATHAINTAPKKHENNLNIFYLNIRSLKNKIQEIKLHLQQSNVTYHVIALAETWLTEEDIGMYELENYTSYNSVRKSRIGAGVSIYVINSINSNLNLEFSDDHNNFIVVYLRKYDLKIISAYNTNNTMFLDKLEDILSKNNKSIILGDMNIDLLSTNSLTNKYRNLILANGYHIINKTNIKHATRISATTKTIIDHAISDLINYKHHVIINSHSFTDHESLTLQIKINNFKSSKYKVETKRILNYDKCLKNIINKTRTTNLLDVNFVNYHKILSEIIKKNTKSKTFSTNYKTKLPYLSSEIKTMLQSRNKLYVLHKKNLSDQVIKNQFTILKNKITNLIRKAKKEYDSKQIQDFSGDSRKLWMYLNNSLYDRNVKSQNEGPVSMNSENNITVTTTKDICNILNKCFVTVGNLFQDSNNLNNNVSDIIEFRPTQTINYFAFKLINNTTLTKTIFKLKQNTSPGYDGITMKMLKELLPLHNYAFKKYINEILLNSSFPDQLKIAKIVPIFKAGNRESPENYRPIAILPSFAKIVECVIYDQLYAHLANIDFFSKEQYGFLKESGTLTASINLINKIQLSLNNKKHTATLFIDLKKAFEMVQHNKLVQKLQSCNLNFDAILLIKSFLENRYQMVTINETNSDLYPAKCGVPQGSKLAALFYIIFINDIFDIRLHGDIQLYADDIALTFSCDTIDMLRTKMQSDLFKLSKYFDENFLLINAKKTHYIVYKNPEIANCNFKLTYKNEKINRTSETTYLGLKINSKLNWNNQIDAIKTKILPFIGAIKRLSYRFSTKVLKMLYFAYIQSRLTYMIPIWGTSPKYKFKMLQTLQNKIVKIVTKKSPLTATESIYTNGITSLTNLFKFNQCLYIHQITNNNMRNNLNINTGMDLHRYETRGRNNIYIPRTNTGAVSILNLASKEYNTVPREIQLLPTSTFKREFKKKCFHDL